mgnify:CR=1 FL=1
MGRLRRTVAKTGSARDLAYKAAMTMRVTSRKLATGAAAWAFTRAMAPMMGSGVSAGRAPSIMGTAAPASMTSSAPMTPVLRMI